MLFYQKHKASIPCLASVDVGTPPGPMEEELFSDGADDGRPVCQVPGDWPGAPGCAGLAPCPLSSVFSFLVSCWGGQQTLGQTWTPFHT